MPVTVPAEEDGRLVLVGTDIRPGETVAEKDKVKVEVGFLAVEIDDKNDEKIVVSRRRRSGGPRWTPPA